MTFVMVIILPCGSNTKCNLICGESNKTEIFIKKTGDGKAAVKKTAERDIVMMRLRTYLNTLPPYQFNLDDPICNDLYENGYNKIIQSEQSKGETCKLNTPAEIGYLVHGLKMIEKHHSKPIFESIKYIVLMVYILIARCRVSGLISGKNENVVSFTLRKLKEFSEEEALTFDQWFHGNLMKMVSITTLCQNPTVYWKEFDNLFVNPDDFEHPMVFFKCDEYIYSCVQTCVPNNTYTGQDPLLSMSHIQNLSDFKGKIESIYEVTESTYEYNKFMVKLYSNMCQTFPTDITFAQFSTVYRESINEFINRQNSLCHEFVYTPPLKKKVFNKNKMPVLYLQPTIEVQTSSKSLPSPELACELLRMWENMYPNCKADISSVLGVFENKETVQRNDFDTIPDFHISSTTCGAVLFKVHTKKDMSDDGIVINVKLLRQDERRRIGEIKVEYWCEEKHLLAIVHILSRLYGDLQYKHISNNDIIFKIEYIFKEIAALSIKEKKHQLALIMNKAIEEGSFKWAKDRINLILSTCKSKSNIKVKEYLFEWLKEESEKYFDSASMTETSSFFQMSDAHDDYNDADYPDEAGL